MKKFILMAAVLCTSLTFIACKTVWFNDVTLADDGSYIIAAQDADNAVGELYKARVEGKKLKCKLITSENKFSK